MTRTRLVLLVLLAWIAAAASASAASVHGIIKDSHCWPIPGVSVTLEGDFPPREAITDPGGAFAFRDTAGSRYTLVARLPGFKTFLRDDIVPSAEPLQIVLTVADLAIVDRIDFGPNGPPPRAPAAPDSESRCVGLPNSPAAHLRDPVPISVAPEHMMIDSQPAGRIRIVAMGDSTTAGTPAFKSPREAPPGGSGDETSQYAYWLMKAHPDWDVVNQGVNAQRSDVIAARFDEDVVAKRPAVVVIIAGVNDVYQGRPAQHVKEQLAAMYKRAHDAGIRVVAGTIIPYNTATPDQNARMNEINDWIRTQGRADPGVVVVDTRAAVAAPDNPDTLASSPDGLHPDAAGYRRMADAIRPAVEQALGTKSNR
jgi:lysophospholipase L1-like esterase